MSEEEVVAAPTPNIDEDEECKYTIRAKLWRFDSSSNEWKERGVGEARILLHKPSGWYRIVMRRDKTLKVCCNAVIHPSFTLTSNAGSDRSWVWCCKDCGSDGEITEETFAIKLQTPELAKEFKAKFDECVVEMEKVAAAEEATEEKKEEKKEEAKEEGKKEDEEKPEEEKKEEEQS